MLRIVAAVALALATVTSAAWADCTAGEVWSTTDGPVEIRAYKDPGVVTSGPYLFDGRINGKLVWRVTAEYACSNGISFCSLTVPMSSGDPVTTSETVVGPLERPEYVVFADLAQSIALVRFHAAEPVTLKADIFDVKALAATGNDPAVALPNYLKFAGCSKGNGEFEPDAERDNAAMATADPKAVAAASDPISQISSPFDGLWQIGDASCTPVEMDTGPVHIAAGKVKFYESDCEIGNVEDGKASTTAVLKCYGEGEEWGMSLELMRKGNRLMIAYDGDQANAYRKCPAP